MTLVLFETIYHDRVYINPDKVLSVENREHPYDIAEEPQKYAVITVGAFDDVKEYPVRETIDEVALKLSDTLKV